MKIDPNIQIVACPTCDAKLLFCRSRASHIDSSGFESYSLECTQCGDELAGIIDPADNALLLSQLAG